MEEFMGAFNGQISELQQCLTYREIDIKNSTELQALGDLDAQITALQVSVDRFRAFLAGEEGQLVEGRKILSMVSQQNEKLRDMQKNLPPRMLKEKDAEKNLSQDSVPAPGAKSDKVLGKKRTMKLPPRMDYVKESEFNNCPLYMRGRMSREHLNQTIDTIYTCLTEKYKILGQTRTSMGEYMAKKFQSYKDAETEECEQMYFFIDDDIKQIRGTTIEKTTLVVLRYLGRMKELRSNGVVRHIQVLLFF